MSIIIKDVETPEDCLHCLFKHIGTGTGLTQCVLVAGWVRMKDEGRPDACPIVEIPEKHGRLIDADEKRLRITLKCIREGEYQIYKGGAWGFAAKAETAIDDAPTVFEAEGQE